MKKKTKKTLILVSVAIVGALIFSYGFGGSSKNAKNIANAKELTIYKSTSCGCCGMYVSYLRKQGFKVNVENMDTVSPIKNKYNIPKDMESCHTTVVGDYVVEGHVPFEAINKMLDESPDIKGIALPDMPSGSPGMPGNKQGSFTIHSLTGDDNDSPVYIEL